MPLSENGPENDKEKQEAIAFLRERFLYLISSLPAAKSCKINMHDNTRVSGHIKAFDLPFENIFVENLKTELPQPLKNAILRTNDVLTISYCDI